MIVLAFLLGALAGAGIVAAVAIWRRRFAFHPIELEPVFFFARVRKGERVEFTARTDGRLTWERG